MAANIKSERRTEPLSSTDAYHQFFGHLPSRARGAVRANLTEKGFAVLWEKTTGTTEQRFKQVAAVFLPDEPAPLPSSASVLAQVELAIVDLPGKEGRGVLVNGGLILTAAHCITFSCEGEMALGDYFIEQVQTIAGEMLRMAPLAVEPVLDIAVLGELDSQEFGDDVELLEAFCRKTLPVPLALREPKVFEPFPVYVYNLDRTWTKATAKKCNETTASLFITAECEIAGGASGGPIVNEVGELVGIVSVFSEQMDEGSSGPAPRPALALPVWVARKILGSAGAD